MSSQEDNELQKRLRERDVEIKNLKVELVSKNMEIDKLKAEISEMKVRLGWHALSTTKLYNQNWFDRSGCKVYSFSLLEISIYLLSTYAWFDIL